jgi:hypothetical protein
MQNSIATALRSGWRHKWQVLAELTLDKQNSAHSGNS